MTAEGKRLDPADWDAFAAEMQALLAACVDHMQDARDRPWQPVPDDFASAIALDTDEPGMATRAVFAELTDRIMPQATGNTHPAFFGWVHGTGLPVAVGAELVAASMNSNCGGRDHAGPYVEQAVIGWVRDIAGMPEDASGILTTGTSQATILALTAARHARFGKQVREDGIAALPPVRIYARRSAHSCVAQALELLGHGRKSLRLIDHDEAGAMDAGALRKAIAEDRAAGIIPLAIAATAGSVDLGEFDDIDGLADIAANEDLWLHVDGAFGFWTRLADAPWRDLASGIGRANSLACDFHKWMSVPYSCGACLVRDEAVHRAAFTTRPSYLSSHGEGLAGGDWWAVDYGLDLSRGFTALKVWTAIKAVGTATFGAAITDNCRQAALMADLAETSEWLEVVHRPVSNICCFRPKSGSASAIAARLQLSGEAVFSTTKIGGRECLRAAIVNHRTTESDIRRTISAVEREARAAAALA